MNIYPSPSVTTEPTPLGRGRQLGKAESPGRKLVSAPRVEIKTNEE